MGVRQEKVSMPMTSAGILGVGSDMKLSGIEIDPRSIIIVTLIFVGLVKLVGILLG